MKPSKDYEYIAELKAKELVETVGVDSIPVNLEMYTDHFDIEIVRSPLSPKEAGNLFTKEGKKILLVNSTELYERQRFTLAHEVSHVLLEHSFGPAGRKLLTQDINRYTGKSREEKLADVCAAELLMPQKFFEGDVKKTDLGFQWIRELASKYEASLTSTGLRYARFNPLPCAFVIVDDKKKVHYVKGSQSFKEDGSFINIGKQVDTRTVAYDIFDDDDTLEGSFPIDVDAWLDEYRGKQEKIYEESIFLREFNRVLTLLWYDTDDDVEVDEITGDLKFKRK